MSLSACLDLFFNLPQEGGGTHLSTEEVTSLQKFFYVQAVGGFKPIFMV